ncbi:M16 family metallopeptidase [Agilicoccus flavus]|uniref:M16 family metallopeptidase n=1 Tax=Agilicoccus flavus TaxID=2775968 RepID=UPI001CF65C4B|nr:pitrilysin family protein [Agilicoccus flavus]
MPLSYEIATTTLSNGLRVVVNPDRRVPVVAVNLWVGVGSRHEAAGHTGFAHLFEHLMFQGSEHVASGEHFSAIMGVGGRLNATTWFDRTNYFETVPRGAYELALWMEADRHGRLLPALTQANLDNQRDVVKEEKRQRYDNVPYGTALHTLYGLVFPLGHPYHHPTIGSMADLDAASLADVHAFFATHYRPSNTVLTLVGDLGVQEGFAAAERYFGDLPDRSVPEGTVRPDVPSLPPLQGPVRVDVDEVVPAKRVFLGFRLPPDNTPEFFAAAAALDVLGGLETSRLERRLVRDGAVADHVSAAAMGLVEGTSLGFLAVEVADGHTVDEVVDVVGQELSRLGREGPSALEMETVFAQNERAWLSSLASLEERADHIGQQATLYDDPRGINTVLDRLAAVTADEVTRVAARWLDPSAAASVVYDHDERGRDHAADVAADVTPAPDASTTAQESR